MGGGGEVISRSESLRPGPSVVFIGLVLSVQLNIWKKIFESSNTNTALNVYYNLSCRLHLQCLWIKHSWLYFIGLSYSSLPLPYACLLWLSWPRLVGSCIISQNIEDKARIPQHDWFLKELCRQTPKQCHCVNLSPLCKISWKKVKPLLNLKSDWAIFLYKQLHMITIVYFISEIIDCFEGDI